MARARLARFFRQRELAEPRVRLVCAQHDLSVVGLRNYVTDDRPNIDEAAPRLIRAGECPACPNRYVHKSTETPTFIGESLRCACCGTSWTIEREAWVADIEEGLQPIDLDLPPLPNPTTIDRSSFEIVVFDDVQSISRILGYELRSIDHLGVGFDARVDEVLDDLLEGIEAASKGKADEQAEIYRSVAESQLDEMTSETIASCAIGLLREIHDLLDQTRSSSETASHIAVPDELFRGFIQDAIDSLPEDFRAKLENVAITVGDRNRDRYLYGIYKGVSLPERQVVQFGHLDVITVYKDEICENCRTLDEVRQEVRETVLHEIGHHFGISDHRLRELGY